MMEAGDFAYAQARLQARFGTRLPEPAWGAIEAAIGVRQYVENARATSLATNLDLFGLEDSARNADQALRAAWRREVTQVAQWLPSAWQSAVVWLATALDLPASQTPRDSRTAEPSSNALASKSSGMLVDEWLAAWRRTWPRANLAARHDLEHLITLVQEHRARMADAPNAAAGRTLRRELGEQLARQIHRASQSPAAVVAYLLLVALDLERLRDGLIRRLLIA